MSGNQIDTFTSLYVYGRAQGLQHEEAMSATRHRVVMKYAFMTKVALVASLIASFGIVLTTPWFAHAGGMERIHAVGWMMMVTMVLIAYFPFKAKSGILWGVYGVIAILVAALAFL